MVCVTRRCSNYNRHCRRRVCHWQKPSTPKNSTHPIETPFIVYILYYSIVVISISHTISARTKRALPHARMTTNRPPPPTPPRPRLSHYPTPPPHFAEPMVAPLPTLLASRACVKASPVCILSFSWRAIFSAVPTRPPTVARVRAAIKLQILYYLPILY